ncbi:MAG: hypothetical protein OXB88_02495 [Bacteriovoracales bacterium]|nr:hypothetical protein [Bacteriovoracales bacterium]
MKHLLILIIVLIPLRAISLECSKDLDWKENLDRYETHYEREKGVIDLLRCSHVLSEIVFDRDDVERAQESRSALMKELGVKLKGDKVASSIELALYLQKVWEARFLEAYGQVMSQDVERGKLGVLASFSLLGLMAFRNPLSATRYFQKFNQIFPRITMRNVGIAGAGGVVLYTSVSMDKYTKQMAAIPKPPAHDLDFIENHPHLHLQRALEKEFLSSLIEVGIGGAAATGAYKWGKRAMKVNKMLTPLKWSPVVLIGSLAIGVGVEYGVDKTVDRIGQNYLRGKLADAIEALEEVREKGLPERERLGRGAAFVQALQRWAIYHYKDVFAVFQNYGVKQGKALAKLEDVEKQMTETNLSDLDERRLERRWHHLKGVIARNDDRLAKTVERSTDAKALERIQGMGEREIETLLQEGDYPKDYGSALLLGAQYLLGFDEDFFGHFASRLTAQAKQAQLLAALARGEEI